MVKEIDSKFVCGKCGERYNKRALAERCEQKGMKPFKYEVGDRLRVNISDERYNGIVVERGTERASWLLDYHENYYRIKFSGLKPSIRKFYEDGLTRV